MFRLLLLGEGWADCAETWYASGVPSVVVHAVIMGGVSLHVRTCTPHFCISGMAPPIVFKFSVWVGGYYLSAFHALARSSPNMASYLLVNSFSDFKRYVGLRVFRFRCDNMTRQCDRTQTFILHQSDPSADISIPVLHGTRRCCVFFKQWINIASRRRGWDVGRVYSWVTSTRMSASVFQWPPAGLPVGRYWLLPQPLGMLQLTGNRSRVTWGRSGVTSGPSWDTCRSAAVTGYRVHRPSLGIYVTSDR